MDTFSHLFIVKLECLFETTKIHEKEAGMAHFKKRFLSPRSSGLRFAETSVTRMVEAWCIGFDAESNLIGVATKDKKLNFWRHIQNGADNFLLVWQFLAKARLMQVY